MSFSPDSSPPPVASGKATASLWLGIGSFFFGMILSIPGIILGVLSLKQIRASQGRLAGRNLAVAGVLVSLAGTVANAVLAVVLLPVLFAAREQARIGVSTAHMKQLNAALLEMHDDNNLQGYPPAADDSKARPVSWRVALLPYLHEQRLHDAYDQSQPWDSPKNSPITSRTMAIYHNPNDSDSGSNKTNYLAIVGKDAGLSATERLNIGRFKRPPDRTILFVEANADRAVPWTKPTDIAFDSNHPLAGLGQYRPGGFLAVCLDGSVQTISPDIDPQVFQAMVSHE